MTDQRTLPDDRRLARRHWVCLRPEVIAEDLRQVNQAYIDRHLMNRRLEVVDQQGEYYIVKDPGCQIGRFKIHYTQIIRPI